ncbi:MAG: urease accessory protein UreD [Gammaproteobacteria bacterium]
MNMPQLLDEHDSWQAQLQLTFKQHKSRTVMGRSHHYGPLRVQRPFYPEGNLAHIYILHPPGGVVGGDQLNIELDIKARAQLLCTTPGSGKFYLSAGHWAQLEQQFHVEAGASLEWLPQENILFDGARLRVRSRIELEDDAVFIGWDINCLGRPSSHERFEQGLYDARLELYHNQQLLLVENQRVFEPQMLDSRAGLRGQAIQATLLAYPCDDHHVEAVRQQLTTHKLFNHEKSAWMAVTLIDGLLVMRALADNTERLKQQLTQVWQTLRPMMLKRDAMPPRIWNT